MSLIGELTTFSYDGSVVADLISINGADSSVAEVEITTLGSSSKKFRPSAVVESGTLSFSFYYDPSDATHVAIREAGSAPLGVGETPSDRIVPCVITYSDTTTHSFNGFVTSVSMSGNDQETDVQLDAELRITGDITETVAV